MDSNNEARGKERRGATAVETGEVLAVEAHSNARRESVQSPVDGGPFIKRNDVSSPSAPSRAVGIFAICRAPGTARTVRGSRSSY